MATTIQIQAKLAELYTKRAGIEKKMGEAQAKKAKKDAEADTKMAGYRTGYDTSFTIKRSDYNMPAMVGPVGDEVTIFVSIEGVRE